MTGLFPSYSRNSGASIQEMTSSSHLPPCSTTPSSHPRSTVGMAVAKPFIANIAPVVGLPSISMQPCSPTLDCCACSCYCPASCLPLCMAKRWCASEIPPSSTTPAEICFFLGYSRATIIFAAILYFLHYSYSISIFLHPLHEHLPNPPLDNDIFIVFCV